MRVLWALAALVALLAAGCLSAAPAPLPPEGEVFTAVGQGCGQQLVAHEDVWVTYPDRRLYHVVVADETDGSAQEDRRSGDVNVSQARAVDVLEGADRAGALDLTWYRNGSGGNGTVGTDVWHAELDTLSPSRFLDLRRRVSEAALDARQPRYTEPHTVVDGCGIDAAAWTPGGYASVYRTSSNGPEEVRALDGLHDELHPNR
jgi:hypothetical protein